MHRVITPSQVIGRWDQHPAVTPMKRHNVALICRAVNTVCLEAEGDGVILLDDPDTGTAISGARGGNGSGGIRVPEVVSIATASPHYDGNAVDRVDAKRALMRWCLRNVDVLVELGLYLEHPQWTSVWVHFQRVPPKSRSRFFIPYRDMEKFPPTCMALPEQAFAGVTSFRFAKGNS